MGGGYVAKEKFVHRENGTPLYYFSLDDVYQWICGGCYPVTTSVFNWLEINNVGMIVTLTIDPLHPGRCINHLPKGNDSDIEWTDSDFVLEDTNNFVIEHIPIHDASYPTKDNLQKLFDVVTKFRQEQPDKKVYFHCWAGKGRTCTIICEILMRMYGLSYKNAVDVIYKKYPNIRLSDAQNIFLQRDDDISVFDDEELEPKIYTPDTHKCYIIKNDNGNDTKNNNDNQYSEESEESEESDYNEYNEDSEYSEDEK